MDVYQRTIRADSSPPISVDDFREIPPSASPSLPQQTAKKPQKPMKRSFDVAFLMAPDDLSKKREEKQEMRKQFKYMQSPNDSIIIHNNAYATDGQYQMNPLSLTINSETKIKQEVIPSRSPDTVLDPKENPLFVRSAFTKVSNANFQFDPHMISRTPPIAISPSSVSSNASNRSGFSPDLTYQDSLSPQPFIPVSNRSPVLMASTSVKASYQTPPPPPPTAKNLQYFVASQLNAPLLKDMRQEEKPKAFPTEFVMEAENLKSKSKAMPPSTKTNFPYHADNISLPYTGFPMSTFPFPPTATAPVPIFPTTANLTAALLPPSFAALTLPAQNVCAKCNMHFRMTSDLVYHMRSHHKNENAIVDPYKRRRDQDKLKCPVCNESFRERHHLTRHMTAHQDKEDEDSSKEFVDVAVQRPISGSAK